MSEQKGIPIIRTPEQVKAHKAYLESLMSNQGELSDSKIKQMWVDAWAEQDTGVEPDEDEIKALRSFLAKALKRRLDRPFNQGDPELREKIAKLIDGWHNKPHPELRDPDTAIPIELAYEDLAAQILAFIPDVEAISKLRNRLTELEKRLDDREEDLIEAKREEGERIYNMPLYQVEIGTDEVWARFNKTDWQALKGE